MGGMRRFDLVILAAIIGGGMFLAQKTIIIQSDSPSSKLIDGTKVVAYSMYGENPRYVNGAKANALLIPEIYPGSALISLTKF